MRLLPEQIIALQRVIRWHTQGTTRQQSVAEHSAGVAQLALYLAPDSTSAADRGLIMDLALIHDAHEAEFGDYPAPAKRRLLVEFSIDIDAICRKAFWGGVDPYEQFPPHVQLLVNVADVLEAAVYAQQHLPEIAIEAVQDAMAAGKGLSQVGFVRVLQALGVSRG